MATDNELIGSAINLKAMTPISRPAASVSRKSLQEAGSADTQSFSDVLAQKLGEEARLSFSKHASQRLDARDISFTGNQLERIENGVAKAAQKGIKDSLVMVDDVCLVVSTKNKVVITAMVKGAEDSVFTNIDGAVIV